MLNRDSADSLFVLQSGLAGANGESAPTHQATFTADTTEWVLAPGQSELRVPLHWTDGHGVTVTKTLSFRRGQYSIGLDYQVHNAGSTAWSFAPYAQILRYNTPIERSYFRVDSYAFKGPAIYDGTKYEKLDITKEASARSERDGGLDRSAAAAFRGRRRAAGRCALSLPAARPRATSSCSAPPGRARASAAGSDAAAHANALRRARSCRRSSTWSDPS